MLTFRLKAAALLLLGFLQIPALQAGTPPLVLEASAKDIGGLSVRFTYKDKELSRYEFKGGEGQVVGAVTLPAEAGASYEITAYNKDGKITNYGTGEVPAANDDGRPRVLAVPASGDFDGLEVSLASERIVVTVKQGESNQFNVQADIFDPDGNPVKIDPIEIRWGLSDGRNLTLKPLPDGPKVVLVPNKGITLERLCVTPPEVFACTGNGHCRPIRVCSDPWTTVSAGDSHTCALTKSGQAFCWGSNTDGQLGSTTTTACSPSTLFNSDCSTRPKAVTCPAGSPCRFTQISAGTTMTAAIDTNGDAWWWGRGGVAHHKVSATLLGAPQKFIFISAGFGHACALSGRSEVWCWGTNGFGESGLPARSPQEVSDQAPNRVLVPFTFRAISVAGEHSCALGSGGTDVVCWGRNDDNQTSGTAYSQSGQFYFQQFGGLTQIQDIATSRASSCAALGWGNGVRCWGSKWYVNVASLGTPETVTVGNGQVCGLSSQTASCVGSNNWGELGIGSLVGQSTAVPVKAPPPLYSRISAGEAHTCGLTPDADIFCWGRNTSGQVGNGGTAYSVREPTLAVKP